MLWTPSTTHAGHELHSGATFDVAGTTPRACADSGAPPAARACTPRTSWRVQRRHPVLPAAPARPAGRTRDFDTIIDSIRDALLTLPGETDRAAGHGDATTIGAEAPHLEDGSRDMIVRTCVASRSDECAASLYLPDQATGPVPCIE